MAGKFSYASAIASPYIVPAGKTVLAFYFLSTGGGTLKITPKGAGNDGVEGGTITVRANIPFARDFRGFQRGDFWPMLGEGTIFTFTGIDDTYVEFDS